MANSCLILLRNLARLRGDSAVKHDAPELPFAIGLPFDNPKVPQAHLFNTAAQLRCSRGSDSRSRKSPMPCRLDLIVNQAAFFFIGLGVIMGETTDLFFADDGRAAGGHDNYLGIHRCHTPLQILSVCSREKLFP